MIVSKILIVEKYNALFYSSQNTTSPLWVDEVLFKIRILYLFPVILLFNCKHLIF